MVLSHFADIIYLIDQEAINKQLQAIFGIQTGYHGTVVSTFAKVNSEMKSKKVNSLLTCIKPAQFGFSD